MTNIRLFSVIAVSVVVTALTMGAITRPARADTPRTAECKYDFSPGALPKYVDSITTWMNTELAAGRTNFFMPPGGSTVVICAW